MPDTMREARMDADPGLIEGMARVVEIDGPVAWLEPEQSSSCGGCAASGTCGAKGLGTIANRLATRRFPIVDHPGLVVGEQVVVGVRPDALLKAAVTAYAIPLVTLFAAGGVAQWAIGTDGITFAASLIGLALGMGLAHLGAGRLFARGAIAPRFLHRTTTSQTCQFP